jgi:CBS domain containing-hemolysin-like protein
VGDPDPASSTSTLGGLILLVAILVSFLSSGTITALITVLRMQRGGLIPEDFDLPGKGLLGRPRSVLLTATISFLAAAAISAAALPEILRGFGRPVPWWLWALGGVLHLVTLVLGSVAMKAVALARPVGYFAAARWVLWPVFLLLRPLTRPLEGFVDRVVPTLWALDLSPPLSGQEIRGLLADEEAAAHLQPTELDWARSILELGDTEIREIMVPRIDMVSLDVATSFEEALPIAAASRFTRLPVYEKNPDRILGILHTKDLLAASVRGEQPTIRQLLRPVHFLPESKRIDEALREFQQGRIHLAVVVDEYGGTAGIVTLEDILEEIVGEIRDEFDQEGELVRLLDEHRAVIDPRIDLDDLNELLHLQLPTEDSDTLGGLLYSLSGRVPSRGDVVQHGTLRFTIDRVERQRIRQVTLSSEEPLAQSNGSVPPAA